MVVRRWTLILIPVLFILGTALFWPGSGRSETVILVSSGDTAHKVANELIRQNHLKTKIFFLIWTRLRGVETQLKVGQYIFPSGRSAYWVVDDLLNGRTKKIRVPIPEGFASWQIAERLELFNICPADKFLSLVSEKNLEGYLFPATYDFDLGSSAESIIQNMTNQFNNVWTPEMSLRADQLKLTQNEVVTLASIIEREIMVKEEMSLVSSVYHNRLKRGMRLEADPTVQYALGYWKKRLLHSDLKNTNSPYNTYKYKGLPPAPICNPGKDAIVAALFPAQTENLFFVAQEDGTHTFSRTYNEHLGKVKKRDANRQRKR